MSDANSRRGLERKNTTENVVLECPSCEHRVLMFISTGQVSPVTYCGCGDLETMRVVGDD